MNAAVKLAIAIGFITLTLAYFFMPGPTEMETLQDTAESKSETIKQAAQDREVLRKAGAFSDFK